MKFRWSAPADAQLRALYPLHTAAGCARAIGCTVSAVYNRAAALGLHKAPEFFTKPECGQLGADPQRGAATRFRRGQTPWNKGQRFEAGGRSVETRFKPGRKPQDNPNYSPIGSLRICKDGYLERKVTDDQRLVPARRWTAVHRLVWEAEHGPVPAGHAVVFKPNRRSTEVDQITVDALELVTRAELMRRNSYHTHLPPEVARLVQLRGALNRKIRNRTKQQ